MIENKTQMKLLIESNSKFPPGNSEKHNLKIVNKDILNIRNDEKENEKKKGKIYIVPTGQVWMYKEKHPKLLVK